MGKFGTVCAAAALVLFAGGPAAAESATQTSDLQCLIVGFKMAGTAKDESMKSAAMVVAMYYLGKLDGSAPGLDLEKSIIEQIDTMKAEDLAAAGQRCGGELQNRGKALEVLGAALTQKGY